VFELWASIKASAEDYAYIEILMFLEGEHDNRSCKVKGEF